MMTTDHSLSHKSEFTNKFTSHIPPLQKVTKVTTEQICVTKTFSISATPEHISQSFV